MIWNWFFSTGNPLEVLEFVKSQSRIIGLYFLDVDLQHEMSGLTLAAKIRDYDNLGKIVLSQHMGNCPI